MGAEGGNWLGGACAWVAWPTILASGVSPAASAVLSRIITSAAAPPSEIELAFAAVTVPFGPKAGGAGGDLVDPRFERLFVLRHDALAAALLQRDLRDLAREMARCDRRLRTGEGLNRIGVLCFAGEAELPRAVIRECAIRRPLS